MIFIIIIIQIVIALGIIVLLKCLLERELIVAAYEALSVKKNVAGLKCQIITAKLLSDKNRQELLGICDRLGINHLDESIDASIKGGIIIKLADQVLDFSVSKRLAMLLGRDG